MTTTPREPDPGTFCDECGHFAARHGSDDCVFPTKVPALLDTSTQLCNCTGLLWLGWRWRIEAGGPVPVTSVGGERG